MFKEDGKTSEFEFETFFRVYLSEKFNVTQVMTNLNQLYERKFN